VSYPPPSRHSAVAPALLVASSGGHLNQLYRLRDGWPPDDRLWVTFSTPDARELLARERVVYAHHPTNRHLPNLVRNAVLAARLVSRVRPSVLVTTGAGVAVPFAYAAFVSGVPVIYVEGLGRVHDLSLSARLAAPAVSRLFVQWPEIAERYRKAEYAGTLL
jgi:beta-1,4-N-acetylglucosaminyltransferase